MTKAELKGKVTQAIKDGRAAVATAEAAGCTPAGHAAVCNVNRALMDIHEAETEYTTNGATDEIADSVAAKLRARPLLTINGRPLPMPSSAALWRMAILAAVIGMPTLTRGCSPQTAATANDLMRAVVRVASDPQAMALAMQVARGGTNDVATARRGPPPVGP